MKVNLFTDKQVNHFHVSAFRKFSKKFDTAIKEIETLLDAEIVVQRESNEKIAKFIKKRADRYATIIKVAEISKQLNTITEEDYYVHSNWDVPSIKPFVEDLNKATIDYNERTEKLVQRDAEKEARKVLGIDMLMYRRDALAEDLKARIALMGVLSYDSALTLLEQQISIKDYFVTL